MNGEVSMLSLFQQTNSIHSFYSRNYIHLIDLQNSCIQFLKHRNDVTLSTTVRGGHTSYNIYVEL